MDAEPFGGDHILALHRAFRLQVQTNGRLARVDCLHDTADDFAFLLLEELILLSAFCVADFLLDRLAGSLGCYAAKVIRSGFHHHQIAKLAIWIDLAGIFQQDFSPLVKDLVSDFFFGIDCHGSLVEIDIDPDFLGCRRANRLPIGGHHGRVDCSHDHITGQALVFQDLVEG